MIILIYGLTTITIGLRLPEGNRGGVPGWGSVGSWREKERWKGVRHIKYDLYYTSSLPSFPPSIPFPTKLLPFLCPFNKKMNPVTKGRGWGRVIRHEGDGGKGERKSKGVWVGRGEEGIAATTIK